MPIRFAPARSSARPLLARGLGVTAPANDVGQDPFDPLLEAALRHFARYGVGSVAAALAQAEEAQSGGNEAGAQHCLAIAGLFARRQAPVRGE